MSSHSLFRIRRFGPLFWTQFFGALNDNFLKIALTVAITYRGVQVLGIPAEQMGAFSGGLFILPFFLFSAIAGQLADGIEKSRLILWIKALEILIVSIAAVGFHFEEYRLCLLALFLMGTHSTFFGPLKYSILPQHLTREELIQGNAYIEAGTFMAILLGLIAGGWAMERGSEWVVLGLFTFGISGLLTCLAIPRAPSLQSHLQMDWTCVRPTREILAQLKQQPEVHQAVRGISWFWLYGSIVLSVLPPLVKAEIGGDPSILTFFLTLFSIGVGIGSVLTGLLSRGHLELGLVPLGSIGMSVFGLIFSLAPLPEADSLLAFLGHPSGIVASISLLMIAVSGGFFTVPLYTIMQERSHPSTRSRSIAGNNIHNAWFMVLGSLILMLLLSLGIGFKTILLILAVTNSAVVLASYRRAPTYFLRFIVFLVSRMMYRVQVRGLGNIPPTGPAILIANHVSFIDWLIIMGSVRRPVRFVMDHAFGRGLIMGEVVKQSRIITISTARESLGTLRTAFQEISDALRAGELVVVFPEGGITRDGKLQPFKKGIERMLESDPVPVIPMGLRGLWGSFFSRLGGRAFSRWPGKFRGQVTLEIGTPLAPEGLNAAQLEAAVRALIKDNPLK